jgi:hypothetical protein
VSPRFPFPIPSGWFAVAWSDELEPGDGRCAAVPYAKRVPPNARIRSWPVNRAEFDGPRLLAENREVDASPTSIGVAFAREFVRQFRQDIPIWEAKTYLPRPILCDGAIGQFRAWATQFHAGAEASR